MDIHPYVIQSRSELGSKRYIFMEKEKKISVTNLFQHLLSAEILSKLRTEFYHIQWKNFQINATNKLTTKCLTKSFHYTRPHIEYGRKVYAKNKLGSQIII